VGRLFTGKEVLSPGWVVLSGGKVVSAGKDPPASPPPGRRVDLPGAWATPGWIDAASTTGLAGGDSEMTREVTPCVRALRAFDPRARETRRALRAGVTTLFLEPGSANVVGGIASLVKTCPAAAGGPRVLRESAALRLAFGSDPSAGNYPAHGIPTSIYARRPTTRMGVLAVLRDAWLLGRAAGASAEDADLAAMARAAAGEIPVRAFARTEEDLRTVLRVKDDLGFAPVVEGVSEGYKVADRLAKAGIACVVGPLAYPVGGRGPEWTDPALDDAGALLRAGLRIALTAGGDAAGLRDQAAMAVRWGLPRDAALKAVTSEAAALCGVADRVGTLEKGRDADLVVFDGDPLEPSSRVLLVLVDGEAAFEREAAK
jgi:imidazolonepropionase-like amidohydrolase